MIAVPVGAKPMTALHITDLEAAINYWRERQPARDGLTLAPELRALAEVYARMAYERQEEIAPEALPEAAWAAWMCWYDTQPDTPCIAICSTSQGDAICKGCGRTEDEVQFWPQMTALQKRATWRRITLENTALRFNRYAERARQR